MSEVKKYDKSYKDKENTFGGFHSTFPKGAYLL